jgi:carboxyl-terminal processing protease
VSHYPARSPAAQPFATTGPLAAVSRCLVGLVLGLVLLLAPAGSPPAWALNDAQQLVVEAWKLVNQSYVDPSQLDEMGWRRLRQKTLEKPINRSTEAYDAIEAMLEPLGDAYTRMLRPSEYATLRSNTKGTVCGVGLQLALGDEEAGIVVIAPLDGSPAAEAAIATGSTVLEVNGDIDRSPRSGSDRRLAPGTIGQ